MFVNGAYIDGGIDNRADIAANFRGAKFRLQPDYKASAGLIIDADLGGMNVFATPSITYRSKIFFETPNLEARSQGPVTLVNVVGGVRFGEGRYEISAFARNLFNLLSAFWDKEAGRPVLDQEIGDAIRLTHGGKVVNPRLLAN